MKALGLWLLLSALAALIGFALAWVALFAANAVLPPFTPADDETLREFGPVVLAYGTWGVTALIGSLFAWRWIQRRSN